MACHQFISMIANPMIAFQSPEYYILPKNNLNKNYFRFSKVTSTNQKERRKSTSHAEGNEGVAATALLKIPTVK